MIHLQPRDWCWATWLPRPHAVALEPIPLSPLIAQIERQELKEEAFEAKILPYLTGSDAAALREPVRKQLEQAEWPADDMVKVPLAFRLASYLGMHDEVTRVVRSWPDDRYKRYGSDSSHDPCAVLFGLPNPELILSETRRVGARVRHDRYMRAWLATTGLRDLEMLQEAALASRTAVGCRARLEVLALIESPEAAPYILRLRNRAKSPLPCEQWLKRYPELAVRGLLPHVSTDKEVCEYLCDLVRKGAGPLIESELQQRPELDEAVRQRIPLSGSGKVASISAEKLPAELQREFQKAKAGKRVEWASAGDLPPLIVNGQPLAPDQIDPIVSALAGKPCTLISAVRRFVTEESRDQFAWALYDRWRALDLRAKAKWIFPAVGQLGGNRCVRELAAAAPKFPAASSDWMAPAAILAIEAIGTDLAVVELARFAYFSDLPQWSLLRTAATAAFSRIAQARGLDADELADHYIPSCGLDSSGMMLVDFGERQFQVVLGPGRQPMVRDGDGKLREHLPAATKRDKPELVAAGQAALRTLKKQVPVEFERQTARLEQAMTARRSWPAETFRTRIAGHPIVGHLISGVVCQALGADLAALVRFRAAGHEWLDVTGRPVDSSNWARVSIVHPAHLSQAERTAWAEHLSDHDIVPPFAQLGRVDVKLPDSGAQELTLDVAPADLYKLANVLLAHHNWIRPLSYGATGFHPLAQKRFADGNTVLVGIRVSTALPMTMERLPVVIFTSPLNEKLMLGEVDPASYCDILHDLRTAQEALQNA